MKKLIIIALLAITNVAMAQDNLFLDKAKETLEFQGIPIEGPMKSFFNNLVDKGYTPYSKKSTNILKGKFIGHNCIINLGEDNGNIYSVGVTLSVYYPDWKILYSEFYKIVDLYKKKYGDNVEIKEDFIPPYKKGDRNEYEAMSVGKCSLIATWKFVDENGKMTGYVGIMMTSTDTIFISYTNSKNLNFKKDNDNSQYLNEI